MASDNHLELDAWRKACWDDEWQCSSVPIGCSSTCESIANEMSVNLCQVEISVLLGLFLSEIWSIEASPDVSFIFIRAQSTNVHPGREFAWINE